MAAFGRPSAIQNVWRSTFESITPLLRHWQRYQGADSLTEVAIRNLCCNLLVNIRWSPLTDKLGVQLQKKLWIYWIDDITWWLTQLLMGCGWRFHKLHVRIAQDRTDFRWLIHTAWHSVQADGTLPWWWCRLQPTAGEWWWPAIKCRLCKWRWQRSSIWHRNFTQKQKRRQTYNERYYGGGGVMAATATAGGPSKRGARVDFWSSD